MTNLVEIAVAEVGVKEDPGNRGVPFERYGLPGEQPLAWCARFVRWCTEKADIKIPGNRYLNASVENMRAAFDREGLLSESPEAPCVVFYRTRAGSDRGNGRHCGLVIDVGPLHIQTVEGNFGDKVVRRTVPLKDPLILGYGLLPKEKSNG